VHQNNLPKATSVRYLLYSTLLEKRVVPHPLNSRIWDRERPTAVVFRSSDWRSSDWRVIDAGFMVPIKISLARAVRFFARRSVHTVPCFRAGDSQLPPVSPKRHAPTPRRAETNKQPIPVERELEPTAFWRRVIPEELRRRKAVGARSRACVASGNEVPRPVVAG
jgi:hypothetical protein